MAKRSSSQQERDRAAIKRTKAACGICGQPIDYSLGWIINKLNRTRKPHPRMFVADHIIPIERGGPDVLSNKQAAHWECNSKKRARAYAPIVRRSGTLD